MRPATNLTRRLQLVKKENTDAALGKVLIVIPALNEELAIGTVLKSIPDRYQGNVILVDNGSTDRTAQIAALLGAKVITEKRKGYGSACLAGIKEARSCNADTIVFIDADSSDNPTDINRLLDQMQCQNLDFIIGSRTTGLAENGALPIHARLGNVFATWLLYIRYGYRFTDLGPLRAIKVEQLSRLDMQDLTFGWTVEMQAKALQRGLRVWEIPVHYRQRIGKSKISGTISGSFLAGSKILWIVFKHCFFRFPSFAPKARVADY